MSIDFVERFFKLTLDNVYRFICSLLFMAAIVGLWFEVKPLAQLAGLLKWLAIPSDWLTVVGIWLQQRVGVVTLISLLVFAVALIFTTFQDSGSRAGSTALLSIVMLMEGGWGHLIAIITAVLFGALIVVSAVDFFLRRRTLGSWWLIDPVRERLVMVFVALVNSASYLLSPLGWLITQDPYFKQGSRFNPLYVRKL